MTAHAVIDDLAKSVPTAEEICSYSRRELELRQRLFKGVLDVGTVLEGLQGLMEMTAGCINCNAQPEIPNWAHMKNPIVQHILCGMIEPSKLSTASVFESEETVLDGEEYLIRAQALSGSMNACAFDFYARRENWKYLPGDVDVVVFPKTVFRSLDGYRYVSYLYRDGSRWNRYYHWLGYGFSRRCWVAVLASTEISEV